MKRIPGLSKRGNIDMNAKVFHAVQRTTLRLPLLESNEVYEYRRNHLRICCVEEGVTMLCDILMANHSHTILYSEDPQRILSVFRRLNTGLSSFVWKNVVKGSEFESNFQTEEGYRLFSSTVRLFPIEGRIPLLIDTRYLFDNPKHHNCSLTGLRYEHSNFQTFAVGRLEKQNFSVFYSLYEMYPSALMKLISKPFNAFMEDLSAIQSSLNPMKEKQLFRINPELDWQRSIEQISESYRRFDI